MPDAPSTTASAPSRALIVLFLAALAAPAADMFLRDASARGPEREGRGTRPAPVWQAHARLIHHFPRLFEGHFSDTLGLRDHMLRLYSQRCLNVFGTSPTRDVRIGREGWLFYSAEKSFEVHRGLLPFTETELVEWQRVLEERRDFAASIGAAYVFVIGPNKEAIYPEYMPEGYEPLGPTRLAQLVDWMRAHSDVEFLDLRPSLSAARAEDGPRSRLYFEEGTHWNGRGCMVAAREIERAARAHLPELESARTPRWSLVPDEFAESWRKKMYLDPPDRRRDVWIAPPEDQRAVGTPTAASGGMNYAVAGTELPSMLMFHDSFGPTVAWILAQGFSSTRARSNIRFDVEELRLAPPDLVVELFVERLLVVWPPNALRPPARRALVALNAAAGHRSQARRFEASMDVRVRLVPERASQEFEAAGALRLEVVNDAGGAGLALVRESAADALLSPRIADAPARSLLLRLEVDSPGASSIEIALQSRGRDDWPQAGQLTIALQPGLNRFFVPLHESHRAERVRVRHGTVGGERCVLRQFEIRGVDRP